MEIREEERKNDFSRGSIIKNIMNLALPMTLAQLINVLYNIVDRIYIGRIPEHATLSLTGLGLCLPIISIVIAFANLFGMGGAPLCSIERGRGNEEEAERIMGNSFVLMLATGAVLTVIGLAFKRPILYLFGASDSTFPFANQYITIYLLGNVFVMVGLGMNSFINSQGFGKTGMLTVLLGAVANIILDPIFIFGLHMGVRGGSARDDYLPVSVGSLDCEILDGPAVDSAAETLLLWAGGGAGQTDCGAWNVGIYHVHHQQHCAGDV